MIAAIGLTADLEERLGIGYRDPRSCPLCDRSLSGRKALEAHLNQKHADELHPDDAYLFRWNPEAGCIEMLMASDSISENAQ